MQRKYTKELLEPVVQSSYSVYEVMRKIGLARMTGGSHAHIKALIRKFNLDTSHFTGQAHGKNKKSKKRLPWENILVIRTDDRREKAYKLKRAMLDTGKEYKCALCGQLPTWNGKELSLTIDHIDGNYKDCRPDNIRFLCPNCHSQTETFGSKNKKLL